MKKTIILIFVLLLLSLPIIYAGNLYDVIEYYTTGEDGAFNADSSQWTAQTFTIGTLTINQNYNLSNITLRIKKTGTPSLAASVCLYSTSGGAPSTALVCNYTIDTSAITTTLSWISVRMPYHEMQASTVYAIVFNSSDTEPNKYLLGGDDTSPTYSGGNYYYSTDKGNSWFPLTTRELLFEIWAFNLSTIVADTTPPEITYYNLTSSNNGCESWNTDKSTVCNTSSVVPTVQFNTSENAWCAIAGGSSSTALNLNYTDMGSSRNCTGAASGEGATSHLCTLSNQDELIYDTSYLFISCKDSSNNQNKTSTSGALKLSITGLENAGRNSIGISIQNALLSGYTNYTDLQIYARNLSNAQVKGTFDRAVKKGSKVWAFNRIGVSDSHVNMFNLTPVLYTLEFANATSARITNLTEIMINATK